MLNGKQSSKQDPDYDEVIETPDSYRRINEVHSNREQTIKRIRDILERHFNGEIQAKEEEVLLIEKRVAQTREMIDKVRAYLLANYYGFKGKILYGKDLKRKAKYQRVDSSCSRKKVRENLSRSRDDNLSFDCDSETQRDEEIKAMASCIAEGNSTEAFSSINDSNMHLACKSETADGADGVTTASRFYVHKKIIVGNISKFIPLEKREKNDQASHKWMVYVRGPPNSPDITSYVKQVWFILHPSYMPNDMIEVSKPPFTVTRRGWGEFPVRIQLVFHDPRNKPVDIIHNLKLDKTYTGLQTLGAETTVALELQRHTVEEEQSNLSLLPVQYRKELSVAYAEARLSSKFSEQILAAKKEDEEGSNGETISYSKSIDGPQNLYRQILDRKGYLSPSVASSPVSISASEPSGSRAGSPVIADKSNDALLDSSTELESVVVEALLKNVSGFPLVNEERDITKHHYCANSLEQYKSWSFSKRRASEWQRALDIKRFLVKSGIVDVIKTKGIMFWCRKHGFTPSESHGSVVDSAGLDFCPKCGKCFPASNLVSSKWCSGCLSDKVIKNTSSLTPFEEILDSLFMQESKLETLEKVYDPGEVQNSIVDVTGFDAKEVENATGQSLVDISQLSSVTSYLEVDWIYEAAAQIEVHLPSLDVNGQKIPVLSNILSCALKSLVKDVLTHSYAYAKDGRTDLEPVTVTPQHVLHGLKEIPHLDFLTNTFLGIQEEDGTI